MTHGNFDRRRVPVSQRLMSAEATANSDGNLVTVTMDGREIKVTPGTTLLEAAARLGIHIPTLCTHPDLCVVGNCRVCMVEVDGTDALQAACATPVTEPVTVRTYSGKIRRVRRHMLQLLLAHHDGECHSCSRNGACELAELSEAYGVTEVGFARNRESRVFDNSSSLLVRNMNKCVLCRRCVRACIDMQEVGVMEAVGKGEQIEIETFGKKNMAEVVCIGCGQCISHCPTAALVNPDDTDKVWQAIDNPDRHVVLQLSPSVRVALWEMLGMAPGTDDVGPLVHMLRAAGFNAVFDGQQAAALIIAEQARLLSAIICEGLAHPEKDRWPVLSANCSGWVKYMEHFAPAMLKHMSPLKSPEQLLGTLVRTHYARHYGGEPSAVVSVASAPCASRKFEAESPLNTQFGEKSVDYVLTTVELGKMLKESGIGLSRMPAGKFDGLICTNAAVSFTPGNSMVHQLCGAVFELVTGTPISKKVKIEYTSPFGISGAYIMNVPIQGVNDATGKNKNGNGDGGGQKGMQLRFGKCEGTANAKRVIEDIRNGGPFSRCHFIEFLACPDGCFGGGGHPAPTSSGIRQMRREAFPVSYALAEPEAAWIGEIHAQCQNGTLDEMTTLDAFYTSYMPRGKFMK
ncbi:MAG: (2Fe-2S)-binding protein [Deltaproteobacteria bacterium]|nr:(2Fe-2S)-binding protein [Deltaproteobacteria bacterium]